MSTVHKIPDTRGGRAYRGLLMVLGLSAIVGMADQFRAVFWGALAGDSVAGPAVAQRLIVLAGWMIVCWCAVRAYRKNALPPTWALVALPLLVWAYLLWPGAST